MEKRELYILRGLPGSGKSTLAKSLGGTHFEADQFFIVDGKYKFDASKIKEAHKWCQDSVNTAMLLNNTALLNPVIVVSNTFTQEWEMEPYFDMADYFDYKVFSIIVENRHGGINQHGVSEDKIEQMRNRFEFKL
jgi:energy-coupling factor transporter ATP-binding protein EcfA2